jgi:hypothetical protein
MATTFIASYDVMGTLEEMASVAGLVATMTMLPDPLPGPNLDGTHQTNALFMSSLCLQLIGANGDVRWNTAKPQVASIVSGLESVVTRPTSTIVPTGTIVATTWHWLRNMARRAMRLDVGDAMYIREALPWVSEVAYLSALRANADAGIPESITHSGD